jgi:N-terminal half of MaoC dehydratase
VAVQGSFVPMAEAFRMVVEQGKVREFARATKSAHPEHLREVDPISPPTFLASAAFWQGPEHSAWGEVERNYERVLHGEQEFVFHGPPPRAGTVLTGRSRIDRVYTKQGRRGGELTFTEVVTEFRDAEGELVAETRSTAIVTSQPPAQG